jgi:ornithine cyclodeaminase/alanine dehydrogenase-like protein (mu-crystallin family)
MRDVLPVVREAFVSASAGLANVPLRTAIRTESGNTALFMPAFRADKKTLGAKVVCVFPENLKRSLPLIHAVVILSDPETGAPRALLEGGLITALRTGAAGGVAADLLSRHDSHTVAVIGAGVQGWHQLLALCLVRPIRKAWVVDVKERAVETFVARAESELGIEARPAGSRTSAVADADVVITATTSNEPVFDGHALREGTHINAIGAFTPEMRELDDIALRRCDRIAVDSREAVWAEAGDFIIPSKAGWFTPGHVQAEIGEIAAGREVGRDAASEITLFKTVGLAILDVAVADAIVERAELKGIGVEIQL